MSFLSHFVVELLCSMKLQIEVVPFLTLNTLLGLVIILPHFIQVTVCMLFIHFSHLQRSLSYSQADHTSVIQEHSLVQIMNTYIFKATLGLHQLLITILSEQHHGCSSGCIKNLMGISTHQGKSYHAQGRIVWTQNHIYHIGCLEFV